MLDAEDIRGRLSGTPFMVHFIAKTHIFERQTLDRIEGAVLLGSIGTGLVACVIAACVYDVIHAWPVL
jgi:hypothetical protein